jgi:23S rRNA (uracil1939-C5)-methyltransferase
VTDQETVGEIAPEYAEATIERIVPGGYGLAHGAGMTYLISGGIEGEKVRARLTGFRGKARSGVVEEVLEASPARITPPCPVAGICGGCDFQHMNYEAQLAAKRSIVIDAFRRIGAINLDDAFAIAPSPAEFGYRTRANWHLEPMTGDFGYLAAESHTVVDVDACPILEPLLDAELRKTREGIRSGLTAGVSYDAAAGDDSANAFGGLGEPLPLVRTVGGIRYRFDAPTFFQANGSLLETLVEEALWLADTLIAESGRGIALDLYSGVGLFSIPLATRFEKVNAVESDPRAVKHAKRNARNADASNLTVNGLETHRFLRDQKKAVRKVRFALMDPPRSGLDPETRTRLIEAEIPALTYVSCDPATLARDLKAFISAGYRLERVVGLDCFPQTHHVEMVAHLRLDPK